MVSLEKVNIPLSNGMLPLHDAICYRKSQTIEQLLPHADLKLTDKDGLVAFDHAVHMSNPALAEKIMRMSLEKDAEAIKETCSKVWEVQQNKRQEFQKAFGSHIVPWTPRSEKLKALYHKICLGDAKEAIELVLSDPTLLSTQMEKTKKTFLHLAVEKENQALVLFFLWTIHQLPNATTILEKVDANGKTAEQAAACIILSKSAQKNEDVARFFEEFKTKNFSEKTQELLLQAALPVITETQKQMNRFEQTSIDAKQGFSGNNLWQVFAIGNSDYQAFIRNILDGANILTADEKTGFSLLHLAAQAGQQEIIYLLFRSGLNFRMRSAPANSKEKGLTPLELAQKENKTEAAALIAILEEAQTVYKGDLTACLKNKEGISAGLKDRLAAIDNNVVQYIDAYRKKQAEYTLEERIEKARIAKHGFFPHQEKSQGHHCRVLASIIFGKLDVLVAYAELGADLMTTSVSYSKALEDPLWGGAAGATLAEAKKYAAEALDEMLPGMPEDNESFVDTLNSAVWGRKKGKGKSLLDMAVLYSRQGQDNLDIIAYLLSRGLDPLKLNDEGETPLSMALIKGNLMAANLMMHYADFAEGKSPAIDEKSFRRSLQLHSLGAKLRDPLYINNAKLSSAVLSGTYLLAQEFLGSHSYANFMIHLLMLGSLVSGESYRERLTRKPQTSPLPKAIQEAMPYAWRASILEHGLMPKYPLGTMAYLAGALCGNTISMLSSIKTGAAYLGTRPAQAMYKVGIDGISLAKNVRWFKSLFAGMFFKPSTERLIDRDQCKNVNLADYKNLTIRERLKDGKLRPDCPEHAQIIFHPEPGADETVTKRFSNDLPLHVKKVFRKCSKEWHPDKNPKTNDLFQKLGAAYTTMTKKRNVFKPIEPTKIEPMKMTDYGPFVGETVAKATIIWASTQQFLRKVPVVGLVVSPQFWDFLQWGSIAYQLGRPLASWASSTAYYFAAKRFF